MPLITENKILNICKQENESDSVLPMNPGSTRFDTEMEAIEHLRMAKYNPILFAVLANVDYYGLDDDCPVHGKAVTFKTNEFLHIKDKYNDEWWIGRVVKEGSELGFIPTSQKLEDIRKTQKTQYDRKKNQLHCFSAFSNFMHQKTKWIFKKREDLPFYHIVPVMRPVVIVGPSLKGYDVTDMIQRKVFDFLKNRFEGRVIITNVVPDISQAKRSVMTDWNQQVRSKKYATKMKFYEINKEIERIFELSNKGHLLVLDCNTINHPSQLAKTALSPIMVYIKITSPKVLEGLIKSRGQSQIRHMSVQKFGLQKLLQCPKEKLDVILDENESENAFNKLADYLESYWRATHPIVP